MNAALIYRTRSRWLIWVAFACAIGLHLAAIAIAGNKMKPVTSVASWGDPNDRSIEVDYPPQTEMETVLPPDKPSFENEEFIEENVTRARVHPRKKVPAAAATSSRAIGMKATNSGSAKALALFAPKPGYPYEARRGNVTGSGIADVSVNSESGIVIDAQMSTSTGSAILDKATIEALRRWRFKSGVASNIAVPITFTLTGVSY